MLVNTLPFDQLKIERERLSALQSLNILDSDQEEAYDRIVQVASYICGAPISLISLVDANRQWFKAKVGLDLEETSREVSFCSHAIQQEGMLEIPNATEDARFADNPLVTGDPNIRFYAGAPLIMDNGHKVGTLCVIDREPRVLKPEQKLHLETLANQVVALFNLREQKKQLHKLNVELLSSLEAKLDQQDRVLHLFTRFVPKELVGKYLASENSDLDDAELKHLTIMFCDIRGYTSLVEELPPQKAVAILRAYYEVMSEVIDTYGGMVNQYVGDEIFATFGAPFSFAEYEENAVLCGLEMIKQLKKLNERCKIYTPTPIKVGIGLHAGEVISGTLGSKFKIEYSITGDSVNTGKRVESLTQGHPNTLLISQPIYEKVKDAFKTELWPETTLKGKSKPLEVYKVVSIARSTNQAAAIKQPNGQKNLIV